MAKIMLVEDDNNLREIYEARLLAEGHEIISAHDGEEALAIAVREKPELIISDVMMPKISGFDMLDILRSSPETKNTKIIMMTALSQLEDKDRADRLGADRYLVKSQVTLEDVIRVAHEVLESPIEADTNITEPIAPIRGVSMPPVPSTPDPVTQPPAPDASAPVTDIPVAPAPDPVAAAPAADPITADPVVAAAPDPVTPVVPEPTDAVQAPIEPTPAVAPDLTPQAPVQEEPAPVVPEPVVTIETPSETVSVTPEITSQIDGAQTADAEQTKVEQQIDSFIQANASGEPVSPDPEAPNITAAPELEPTPPVEPSAPVVPDGFIPEPQLESVPEAPAPEPTLEVTPAASATPPEPVTTDTTAPTTPTLEPAEPEPSLPETSPSITKKVIQPIGDPTATPDLEALVAKEAEKEEAQNILNSADIATVPEATESPEPETPTAPKPEDPGAIAL